MRFNSQTPGERVNQRWTPAKNVGSVEIPPHGLVEIATSTNPSPGIIVHSVKRPTAEGIATAHLAVNGPTTIPVGKYGQVTQDWPAFPLYDTGDGVPAIGESWGSQLNLFTLGKSISGFKVMGQTLGAGTQSRVRVYPGQDAAAVYVGRVLAPVAKRIYTTYTEGEVALATVYITDLTDNAGDIYLDTTTVPTVDAYNVLGLPLQTFQLVLVMQESQTGRWIVFPMPGSVNNRGVVLTSTLSNKGAGTFAFTLAGTHGYETTNTLPLHVDTGNLIALAADDLDFAGIAISFSAEIAVNTFDRHATQWAYDTIIVNSSLADARGQWSVLIPPDTLTDSAGHTITPAINGSPIGTASGLAYLPTPFGNTTISFEVSVNSNSGTTYDFLLKAYARIYSVGDGYEHSFGG